MPPDGRYVSRWSVLPLRLFMAALWLYGAGQKLNPTFGGIRRIVEVMANGEPSSMHGNPIEPFRQFLLHVVLPNWKVFGVLITTGELIVGFCLLFGVATRAAALLGAFLFLQYALGRAYLEWPFVYPALIVAQIILFWTKAGRIIGLDAWLFRRRPKWWWLW